MTLNPGLAARTGHPRAVSSRIPLDPLPQPSIRRASSAVAYAPAWSLVVRGAEDNAPAFETRLETRLEMTCLSTSM
jgi:hypothetical protein